MSARILEIFSASEVIAEMSDQPPAPSVRFLLSVWMSFSSSLDSCETPRLVFL